MGKTIAIIVCAGVFALFGLISSSIGRGYVTSLSRADDDVILALAFAPPLAGAVLGLVVGCVAVAVGSWFSREQAH